MPRIWYEEGFSFSFYAADGAEPPHVHVRKAEGRAKWWLREVREARSRGFNERDRAAIGRIVRARRREMLERWNEVFPPSAG
jgi:hypothetical protein